MKKEEIEKDSFMWDLMCMDDPDSDKVFIVEDQTWKWCRMCQTQYMECPKCGNNSCNGGFGKIDGEKCEYCMEAYNIENDQRKRKIHPPEEDFFK